MTITIEEVNAKRIEKHAMIYATIIYNNFIDLTQFSYVTHNKEEIYKNLLSDDMFGYIVKNGTKVIGYLFGEFMNLNDGRHVYYLSYIYISPKYRHYKLGTTLLNKLIETCNNIGVMFIVLTCDSQDSIVMNFYKKFGFISDPILKRNLRHDVLCLYL